MGELRASLYDIFGYLIPGIVALCALRLLSWTVLYPDSVLSLEPLEKPIFAIFLSIIAYALGHLLHAIGNWFKPTKSTNYEASKELNNRSWLSLLFSRIKVSNTVIEIADLELEKHFGVPTTRLNNNEKYTLIDEFRVIGDKENEREVYIYREGFYRGMVISTSLLFLSLLVSLFVGDLSILYSKMTINIQQVERVFYVIPVFIAIIGFWSRMMRFSHYRISRSVAHFLILSQFKNKK